jgi:hypothetical protein
MVRKVTRPVPPLTTQTPEVELVTVVAPSPTADTDGVKVDPYETLEGRFEIVGVVD